MNFPFFFLQPKPRRGRNNQWEFHHLLFTLHLLITWGFLTESLPVGKERRRFPTGCRDGEPMMIMSSSRQDSVTAFPIITGPGNNLLPVPSGEFGVSLGENLASSLFGTAPVSSYLPDLSFWTDLMTLFLGRSTTISPYFRLSRGLFESQKCAEYVSCQLSRFSSRHGTFSFLHNFLQDLPFEGKLAERMRRGSTMGNTKEGEDEICPSVFACSPLEYLNKGVNTLSLLHDVASIAGSN